MMIGRRLGAFHEGPPGFSESTFWGGHEESIIEIDRPLESLTEIHTPILAIRGGGIEHGGGEGVELDSFPAGCR